MKHLTPKALSAAVAAACQLVSAVAIVGILTDGSEILAFILTLIVSQAYCLRTQDTEKSKLLLVQALIMSLLLLLGLYGTYHSEYVWTAAAAIINALILASLLVTVGFFCYYRQGKPRQALEQELVSN